MFIPCILNEFANIAMDLKGVQERQKKLEEKLTELDIRDASRKAKEIIHSSVVMMTHRDELTLKFNVEDIDEIVDSFADECTSIESFNNLRKEWGL